MRRDVVTGAEGCGEWCPEMVVVVPMDVLIATQG